MHIFHHDYVLKPFLRRIPYFTEVDGVRIFQKSR
jgi:hypothetical protein